MRLAHIVLGLALASFVASCATRETRSVVVDAPLVTSFETVHEAMRETWTDEPVIAWHDLVLIDDETPAFERCFPVVEIDPLEDHALDPRYGPVDPGLRLLLDLGAGEAPYDDAVAPIHVVEPRRDGFSDSAILLSWRHPLGSGWRLVGTAAFTRNQDLSIMDGLDTTRFAWVVGGISFRW